MSKAPLAPALLALALAACKSEAPAPAPEPTPGAAAPAAPPAPTPAEVEAAKRAEQVAKATAKLEADTAAETARWTDDLKKQATALADAPPAKPVAMLKRILASPVRQPGNAERDAHRHPLETLEFFGITPKQTVVELGAGEGWYTELLAPLLARQGKLIAVGPDPAGPADQPSTVYGKRLAALVATRPELFGKVEVVAIAPPDRLTLAAPGSVDLVIAMREIHNWQRRGNLDAYLAAVHAALKDGGTFGLEAHRADAGADPAKTVEKGYLPEAWVIEHVTAAGFELAGKSEVNANPKDDHDHPEGVWTLPPVYRLGDTDRATYAAIGESDRMTLRFKKVARPAATAPTPAPASPAK